jgi:DNA-binding NarL/FixJ family response regulator
MIKVMVADDHPIFRAGIKHILSKFSDIKVSCEVDNGADLLKKIREEQFDIILLDMSMPGISGVELIKQIKSEQPKLPILVLSTHKEDIYAVRTIKVGASGYVCKDNASTDLVQAMRKVASGGKYVTPVLAEQIALDMSSVAADISPHTLLSNREFQIFLMIAGGKSITEIAEELTLSVKTVSTHRVRIKEKMNLSNNSDFMRYALTHKLVLPMA